MDDYDVVVCGAGISGLLIASELSKYLSVIVLEKNKRSDCSNKFWLTSSVSLNLNGDLSDCVDSTWRSMDFIASSRKTFTAKGQYILWDTNKLEEYLTKKIESNGSKILYEHRLYSYRYSENAITIFVNDRQINAKLLVDCMGYGSPIVRSTGVVNILGYYHIYGRTMGLKKDISPVAVDNVIIDAKPSYLEVFPKSDGTANVVLISSAKNSISSQGLEEDFEFIVKKTHYSEFLLDVPSSKKLSGIVPIGKIRKKALDRILFFGEAGQVHPAASCTCLTKLLSQYKQIAVSVIQKIESGNLKAQDLCAIPIHMNKFSQNFHQSMFQEMSEWNSVQCESFIDLLHCLDQKSLDDLIFGEIDPFHFMKLENLSKSIKQRNFLWVKPLFKSLFK